MKTFIWIQLTAISIALLWTISLGAQTTSEWLIQKKTQKKYLLQQIAALEVYSGYLLKGYNLVKSGLNTIQKFKNDDANLHVGYFNSLTNVNPKIKKYGRVADIIAMQISIAAQTKKAITNFRRSHQFNDAELIYLTNVINSLLTDCAANLNDLFGLITSGNQDMKDDERLKTIDKLYQDMEDKQIFTRAFCNSTAGLAVQRLSEQNQLIVSKKINDIR